MQLVLERARRVLRFSVAALARMGGVLPHSSRFFGL